MELKPSHYVEGFNSAICKLLLFNMEHCFFISFSLLLD